MRRLTPNETNQIIKIVINHFIDDIHGPGPFLRSLITIYELPIDPSVINYQLPVKELIINFVAKLYESGNFLVFLRGFNSLLHDQANEQDIRTINNCIEKLEREDSYGTQARWNQNEQNLNNFRETNVSLSVTSQ